MSLVQAVKEEAPPVVGGIAGGVAAGVAGVTGLVPIAGAVSLGAGAGEAFRQIGQHLAGSLDAPKTSLDAAKRIGKAALTEGGFELFGGLVAKGFGKILAPFRKTVTPGLDEAAGQFKDKIQPVLLPSEATESRVLDILGNISEASLIGGNRIADFKTRRTKFFDEFADSMIDQFGQRTSPDDLGNLFVTALEAKKKVHAEAAGILYNNVEELIEKATIGGMKKATTRRVYHGRGKPLSKSSRHKEGVGVHFTEDPDQARGVSLFGVNEDLDRVEGIIHGVDLDDSKFISLPDIFDNVMDPSPIPGVSEDAAWNLNAIKIKLNKYSSIPKKDIDRVKSKNDLFKLLKRNGYDGIKYVDDTQRGDTMSYIVDPEIALNTRSIKTTLDDLDFDDFGSEVSKRFGPLKEKTFSIPTKSIKEFAAKVRIHSAELGSIEAKNAGDDLVDAIMDLPDGISFQTAKELRSRLISRVDEFSVINKKAPAIGKAKKMIGLLDEQIEKSLKGLNPEVLDAWRLANRFYRDGQEKYNNTLLRRLIKLADDTGTGAENIAPAIFKPNQVSKVRKVKRALGEGSEEWRNLKGFFVQHLLSKSTDVDGQLVGKRILNNMAGKPNSFGMPVLTEILTGPQIRALEDFGKVLQATQARQSEGAGRMLIQLAQGTAVGRILINGVIEPTTAAVILVPPLLAKMMLNPTTAKLLTQGIGTPAGSEAAAGLLSRIVAASERVRRDMEKQ